MELTDQEWLRDLAKQLVEAKRDYQGRIMMSDELAVTLTARLREIADRMELAEVPLCES